MTNPVRASSGRIEWSNNTDLSASIDVQKSAMAASIYSRLQSAKLIVPDKPFSETARKAIVALLGDADDNGKLDIDASALTAFTGLAAGTTTGQIEAALRGTSVGGVTDAFIASTTGLDFHKFGGTMKTAEGAEVQAWTRGMTLTDEQDRATHAFVAMSSINANSAAECVNGAQVLVGRGRVLQARTLLTDTANELVSHGKYAQAREVYVELTKPPFAAVKTSAVADVIDGMRAADPTFDERTDFIAMSTQSGTQVRIDPKSFATTVGALAQARIDQLDLRARMDAVVGRKIDPENLTDVRDYFAAFSKNKSTAAVGAEFQRYLHTFYKHPGGGTDWKGAVDSASQMEALITTQPTDGAGRRVIDCEGYAFVTASIFRGLKDEHGATRFDTKFAVRPGHIIAAVSDRRSGESMTVSNDLVSAPSPAKSERAVATLIARSLCGDQPNIIGIGDTQAAANPRDGDNFVSPPAKGALVWNGAQLGVVDEHVRADFLEFARRTGRASFNAYVIDLMDRAE